MGAHLRRQALAGVTSQRPCSSAPSLQPELWIRWDTRTFRRVGIPLPFELDAREARARFGPDGQLVVTSGDVLRTFDIDPAHWRERACELTARQLSPAEYEEVLPGKPYEPGC